MKKLLLLLLAVGMIFTACENFGADDPQLPQIEVVGGEESLSLNFPSEGMLTKTVTFKSNYDWSVTTTESWIKVSPESGEAGEECQISVSLDRNDSGETRSGKVTISIEGLSLDLTITQSPQSGEVAIPNNEIWYTSSDGKIVTPNATDVFGAKIVSNTYENGQGVIKFDGKVTQIGQGAFLRCLSLTSVVTPDSVTSIGVQAFFQCTSLTSIAIPHNVTTVGNQAFLGCLSLEAFYGELASEDNRCLIVDGVLNSFAPAKITEYTIPNGVASIGDNAFSFCSKLTKITIPDGVTSIGRGAFSKTALTNITIPDSVTSIGDSAFSGCTSLAAFYGKFASEDNRCLIVDGVLNSFAPAKITEYTIPDGVTSIGDYAFCYCSSLTSITIPDSVTSIGHYAFDFCRLLASVSIGNSVISIGNGAFNDCTSLKEVYCKPTTPPSGGEYMFMYDDRNYYIGCKIYVPAASVEAYKSADYWKDYADDIIGYDFEKGEVAAPQPANNEIWYTSSDGAVVTPYATDVFGANIVSNTYENGKGVITFDGDVTQIGAYAFYVNERATGTTGGRCLTSITIPNSVTSIGDFAFAYCPLADVVIPNGVTKIGPLAFGVCRSLTNIVIPNSVTHIEERAFISCISLTEVTIPDSVISIGDRAFVQCHNMTAFYGKYASEDNRCLIVDGVLNSFAPAEVTEYTIPQGVKAIGQLAFKCNTNNFSSPLKSVTIPDSVTSIGYDAFSGCTSLQSVYCKSMTPPAGGSRMFNSNATDRKIYVPAAYANAYKSADYWKDYADYIIGYNFENGEVAAPQPANNEIWYTSSDGAVVTPYKSDIFGANIVSNTYANGEGVITFDGDVTQIGERAFYNCATLTSISIPNTIYLMNKEAFSGCKNLKRVDISDLSAWCRITFKHSSLSSPLYNGADLYLNGELLVDLVIPSDISALKFVAFYGCTSLKSVTIPSYVTLIGQNAFAKCTSLTNVTMDYGVTTLGGMAFSGCTSLTSITIPDSVTSIGRSPFYLCTSLKAFYGKFTSDDNRCLIVDGVLLSFAPAGLTEYTIPDSATSIESGFSSCTLLTSVTIPNSVTSIRYEAFYGCNNLISVYCKPTTPPTALLTSLGSWSTFNMNAPGRKIYVPTASVEAYKAASGWSDYASSIEGHDF